MVYSTPDPAMPPNTCAMTYAGSHNQSHRYSGIQVASRNVPDCKRHGQDREAERQSDSGEANPEARESRGQHRAPASAEDEPKGSDKFRERSFQ